MGIVHGRCARYEDSYCGGCGPLCFCEGSSLESARCNCYLLYSSLWAFAFALVYGVATYHIIYKKLAMRWEWAKTGRVGGDLSGDMGLTAAGVSNSLMMLIFGLVLVGHGASGYEASWTKTATTWIFSNDTSLVPPTELLTSNYTMYSIWDGGSLLWERNYNGTDYDGWKKVNGNVTESWPAVNDQP